MIKGKVVRILSESEVVLSVGRNDAVNEGDEFVIFALGDQIVDPENGEELGALEIVKGRVKVTHVMEHMSRAKTHSYVVDLPPPFSFNVFQQKETRRYKLPVKKEQIQPHTEDLTVTVGDLVRSV